MGKIFVDFLCILAGFQITYGLTVWFHDYPFLWEMAGFRFQISLLFSLVFVISAERLGQYDNKASLLNISEKTGLLRSTFTTTVLLTAFNDYLHILDSSFSILLSAIGSLILLSIARHFFFEYHHKKYLAGKHERKVLIYGAGETGQLLFKKLYFMEGGDYSLVGFLDDNIPAGTTLTLQRSRGKALPFYSTVMGGFSALQHLVKQHDIYQIMIAMPSVSSDRIVEIIQQCIECNVTYGFVPHLYNLRLEQVDTRNIGDIPLLKKRDYHVSFFYTFAKRLLNATVSLSILLLTLPLFPILMMMVKWGSHGPALFKQKRVGKDGKLFTMYKFRTMSVNTPLYMPSPSSNEPSYYVNRIGSFLRDTNLDEIPQLWNVLKGEMAIVGPRPEMPFHVEKYDEVQRDRLRVKPGLTGLWQISPDRDKEIHDNIDYDLYYINHQSFFLDCMLVLETAWMTFKAVGGKIGRFLRYQFLTSDSKKKESSDLTPPPASLSAPSQEETAPVLYRDTAPSDHRQVTL